MVIDDVSNPSTPSYAGEINTNLSSPNSIVVSGRYAYVASTNELAIFDISNRLIQPMLAKQSRLTLTLSKMSSSKAATLMYPASGLTQL